MAEKIEQVYERLAEALKTAGDAAREIKAEIWKDKEFGGIYLDQSKLEVLEKIAGFSAENGKLLDSAKPEIDKLRLLPEHEALKAQKAQMESSGAQIAALMGKLGCPVENMEFAAGYAERRTELQKSAANPIAFNKAFAVKRSGKTVKNDRYKVGKTITFGMYPQTAEGNDSTPIEWLVLAKVKDKALLISKYALDCVPYNIVCTHVTWETCTLRNWLNNDFFNKAFSAEEKQNIILSKVTADKNPDFSTYPGHDTNDNVFLLSIPEVKNHFKGYASRKCALTDYAVKHGASTNRSNIVDGRASCLWWLRSPGSGSCCAAYVNYDGSVYSHGSTVYYGDFCVRPCVWIRLNK